MLLEDRSRPLCPRDCFVIPSQINERLQRATAGTPDIQVTVQPLVNCSRCFVRLNSCCVSAAQMQHMPTRSNAESTRRLVAKFASEPLCGSRYTCRALQIHTGKANYFVVELLDRGIVM